MDINILNNKVQLGLCTLVKAVIKLGAKNFIKRRMFKHQKKKGITKMGVKATGESMKTKFKNENE